MHDEKATSKAGGQQQKNDQFSVKFNDIGIQTANLGTLF